MGLVLLASAWVDPARACDVCGGSASNQYSGILPKSTYNFIGIQYAHNSFSSAHPSLFENRPDERSTDYYNTAMVWGRYNIRPRLQVFAFLPYRYNLQRNDTGATSMSGIGDVSFLASFILLKDDPEGSGLEQQLLAGAGLKLPAGRYTGVTARDRQGLPNMQPGTGSWDLIANANYTLRHRSSGINLDGSYTATTAAKDQYKYGNRLSVGLLVFRAFRLREFSIMPQAGIRYEYALHDYDNYERRWLNAQSGGYMTFATLGAQVSRKRLGLRCSYQLPVAQHYGAGYVTARSKIDTGLFLLF